MKVAHILFRHAVEFDNCGWLPVIVLILRSLLSMLYQSTGLSG